MSDEDRFWFGKAKYRILEGKRGVKTAYDCMAQTYDHSRYLYWTRRMEDAEEMVTGSWIERFSGTCLDVGSGTGRHSVNIAQEGAEVVALDLSKKMLMRLRLNAQKHAVSERISTICADGENLPFRSSVFDCLVCSFAFDHFMNCSGAAGDFCRVLRDDGLCFVSTFNSRMLSAFQRRLGFPNKVPFRTEDMHPVLIFEAGHSSSEIQEIFESHGFKIVDETGCCYWHLNPFFEVYYPTWMDAFFNLLKGMMKFAEIHSVLMKKTPQSRQ